MDIGQRLKTIRLQAKLSQRELAKRSGVTNGFISQVEKTWSARPSAH
ncbi:helix-turn-helix domain-containing protein [Oceanimonas sp. NS1]|nr:helix-turn-helix domain-containing protein [Oceanimonas sp. NS1]